MSFGQTDEAEPWKRLNGRRWRFIASRETHAPIVFLRAPLGPLAKRRQWQPANCPGAAIEQCGDPLNCASALHNSVATACVRV